MPEITYKIYYSSRTQPDGNMWCPDCILVEPKLRALFNQPNGPGAEIVYVGDRSTWKDPNCIYRQEPLRLSGIPMLVKFLDGLAVGRIGDEGILGEGEIEGFIASRGAVPNFKDGGAIHFVMLGDGRNLKE